MHLGSPEGVAAGVPGRRRREAVGVSGGGRVVEGELPLGEAGGGGGGGGRGGGRVGAVVGGWGRWRRRGRGRSGEGGGGGDGGRRGGGGGAEGGVGAVAEDIGAGEEGARDGLELGALAAHGRFLMTMVVFREMSSRV